MNKINTREADHAAIAVQLGLPDLAARILSTCIRSSLRKSDRLELFTLAVRLGVSQHPEFIVC
jgi:hypothetical protein